MPEQLMFDFVPVEPLESKEKECIINIPATDLKLHVMSLLKLYCVGFCVQESCKDCSVSKLRLFLSRIAPIDFYSAPFPTTVLLANGGNTPEGEDLILLDDLGAITERLGVRSEFTLGEYKRFSDFLAAEAKGLVRISQG